MFQKSCKYFLRFFIAMCCFTASVKTSANPKHNSSGQYKESYKAGGLFSKISFSYTLLHSKTHKKSATSSSPHSNKNLKFHKLLLLEKDFNVRTDISVETIFHCNVTQALSSSRSFISRHVYLCGPLRAPPFC